MADDKPAADMSDFAGILGDALKNNDTGEEFHPVGGDPLCVIEDVGKWKALTNFLTDYVDTSNPWKDVIKQRPIFEDAYEKARAWFLAQGALEPLRFPDSAITIQLHPRTHQLVFIFCRGIGGLGKKECAVPYILSPDQVGWLKATGRWPEKAIANLLH